MEQMITIKEGYLAMYEFLVDLYYREGEAENLGKLLSDLTFLENGSPADPAAWLDWLSFIEKVKSAE